MKGMYKMKVTFLSFILCVSFFCTSFADPVVPPATSSDAYYDRLVAPLAAEPRASFYVVSQRINGKWSEIERNSSSYDYSVSKDADRVRIDCPPEALDGGIALLEIPTGAMARLGQPFFNRVDGSDTSRAVFIPWSDLKLTDTRYGFGYTVYGSPPGTLRLQFDVSGAFTFDFSYMQTTGLPANSSYGRVRLEGVYEANDNKAYSQIMSGPRFGIIDYVNQFFNTGSPVLNYVNNNGWSAYRFYDTAGILKADYVYKFQFKLRSSGLVRGTIRYNNSTSFDNIVDFEVLSSSAPDSSGVTDYLIQYTISPTFDMDLSLVSFCLLYDYPVLSSFKFLSSSSSYFPASDTGGMQQNINNQVTQITNIVSNISNTITNISNQITNAVTNITNQIKDQTTQLTQNADKNADKITQSVDQSADKITENADKNANKITQNADENTNKINENLDSEFDDLKNSYDNSSLTSDQERLDQVIKDYDEAESELFDDAKKHISDFQFEDGLSKYTQPLEDISYFLGGIYASLAGLNIPIGFSLTLTIALLFIGYYRFKGGG